MNNPLKYIDPSGHQGFDWYAYMMSQAAQGNESGAVGAAEVVIEASAGFSIDQVAPMPIQLEFSPETGLVTGAIIGGGIAFLSNFYQASGSKIPISLDQYFGQHAIEYIQKGKAAERGWSVPKLLDARKNFDISFPCKDYTSGNRQGDPARVNFTDYGVNKNKGANIVQNLRTGKITAFGDKNEPNWRVHGSTEWSKPTLGRNLPLQRWMRQSANSWQSFSSRLKGWWDNW